MSKNIFIPLIIIILLLGLYSTRWHHETTFKANEATQVSYKMDRWTGDRWITAFSVKPIATVETPAVSDPTRKSEITWWRNALTYAWDTLFGLSLVWLIILLITKKKEPSDIK